MKKILQLAFKSINFTKMASKNIFSIFIIALILTGCKNRKMTMEYINTPTEIEALQKPKSTNPSNDLQVVIHEEMMNKCFKSLGAIQGKEAYQILFINDSFTWVLVNPQIHLHKGRADFTTDVNIITKGFKYSTPCVGDVMIWYDRKQNLINVKITKCIIEIYTKILGTKYHLKDIDLADDFKDPFTFEGPSSTNSDMEIEMPDGTIRKLYMTTTDCDLTVQEKQLVVPCEMAFSLTPPAEKVVPKKK